MNKNTLYTYVRVNAVRWRKGMSLTVETADKVHYVFEQYVRGTWSKNGTKFRVYSSIAPIVQVFP